MVNLTGDILVAYVDDELDAPTRTEVEAALADDAVAQETVRQLRESAQLAHAACNEALHWHIPTRLLETFRDQPDPSSVVTDLNTRRPARREGLKRSWTLPLAASVALAVGLGGGYTIWSGSGPAPAPVDLASMIPVNTTLHQALETAPSGQPVAWEDPNQRLSGQITPLLTFRDKAERYCREYQIVEVVFEQPRGIAGVACRVKPAGKWTREISVAMHSPAKGTYQPASAGHAALETYVNDLMADAPLDPSAENAVIDGRWQ